MTTGEFWDSLDHDMAVRSLIAEWRKHGANPIAAEEAFYRAIYGVNKLHRENQELRQEFRRLLQEETQKRELLQNQVHLLWDKVHRNR